MARSVLSIALLESAFPDFSADYFGGELVMDEIEFRLVDQLPLEVHALTTERSPRNFLIEFSRPMNAGLSETVSGWLFARFCRFLTVRLAVVERLSVVVGPFSFY